jgi:hypothetical protein
MVAEATRHLRRGPERALDVPDRLRDPEEFVKPFVIDLAESAAAVWREPDAGMWE